MKIRPVLKFLSSTQLFVICTVWLMVLVVAGTLAQTSIGLYLAQQKYFSSWFFFEGFVPLPGGRLTLAIIFLGIAIFVTTGIKWTRRKIGILIIHVGALLLLVGGLITAYFSEEGSMVIPEGEIGTYVTDYHAQELVVTDRSDPEVERQTVFAPGWLKPGTVIEHPSIPVRIEVLDWFDHSHITRRTNPATGDERGILRDFVVTGIPPTPDFSQNRRAVIVRVMGGGSDVDGRYALIEEMSGDQTFEVDGRTWALELRSRRRYLPFALELIDFEKQLHPGTGVARSYKSVVNLIENGTSRRVVIQMNEPLRHRGYTFYQSSFVEGPDRDTTVLAVVKNHGRLFPYISSLVMCVGLLIHLLIQLPRLVRSRRTGVAA